MRHLVPGTYDKRAYVYRNKQVGVRIVVHGLYGKRAWIAQRVYRRQNRARIAPNGYSAAVIRRTVCKLQQQALLARVGKRAGALFKLLVQHVKAAVKLRKAAANYCH